MTGICGKLRKQRASSGPTHKRTEGRAPVWALSLLQNVNVWVWSFVSGDMRVWSFVSGDMRGGFGRPSLLIKVFRRGLC